MMIFTGEAGAQPPDSLWSRVFHRSSYDLFGEAIQTLDSGFMIVSSTRANSEPLSPNMGWMIKTTADGDTEWTRTFEGTGSAFFSRVLQLPNSDYVLGGGIWNEAQASWDLLLLESNSEGDTLWSRRYSSRDTGCEGLETVSDGGFMLAGSAFAFDHGEVDSAWAWLIRTNGNGDSLWSRTFVTGPITTFHAMDALGGGGYILAGMSTDSGGQNQNGWLVRTDSMGDTLWTRRFGNYYDYFTDVRRTSDGGCVAVGTTSMYGGSLQVWIVRCDSAGNFLWDRNYGYAGPDKAWTVAQTSDGGYLVGGVYGTSDAARFWILRLDSLGFLEWDIIPDPDGNVEAGGGQCQSILETADAGFLAAGIANFYTSYNIGVMRYGTPHNAAGEERTVVRHYDISIHPNPFNSQTTLTLEVPREGRVELMMYDVLGRAVLAVADRVFAAGTHHVRIDGSGMATGIYFMRARVGEERVVQKIMLLR